MKLQDDCVSTADVARSQRQNTIRDTAFQFFNLEVDFGATDPGSLHADIRIARGALASLVDVRTSPSIVERTAARARMAQSDNLMVYLVRQGGGWFRNEHGQEFQTQAGTVVLGAQDRMYKATAPGATDWDFSVLSVPAALFPLSAVSIRAHGFHPVAGTIGLGSLLGSYVHGLCGEFRSLDSRSAEASLRSLDHLVAAVLHPEIRNEGVAETLARRRFLRAMRCLDGMVESPGLTPATVADRLSISERQLNRDFEREGTSVSGEIRRLRLKKAEALLRAVPSLSITRVALASGFESLATFHRCFKSHYGMTASELRGGDR